MGAKSRKVAKFGRQFCAIRVELKAFESTDEFREVRKTKKKADSPVAKNPKYSTPPEPREGPNEAESHGDLLVQFQERLHSKLRGLNPKGSRPADAERLFRVYRGCFR